MYYVYTTILTLKSSSSCCSNWASPLPPSAGDDDASADDYEIGSFEDVGDDDGDDDSSSTIRISVSAAYGVIAITTAFVLSFRFVTRKLDECRRKTGRLPT